MNFDLVVRAALRADGELVAPARWTVVDGRTMSLEIATRGEAEQAVDGVLLPGLVNAHSHHDLGGVEPVAATGSFPDWLLTIGATRAADRDVELAAEVEARALRARGVVASGDIDATSGAATRGRSRGGLTGVSYLEIVGVHEQRALVNLDRALSNAAALGTTCGLSPHAPYSVHADALPKIVAAASKQGLPLAMHVAETPEETRFMLRGDGPFLGFLEAIGKGLPFRRVPRKRPIAYVDDAGLLAADGLVIHGNDLDDDDIARLAARGSSVVYCHGTHQHFERPRHRFLDLLAAGVNVALGTDSAASNAGIDLWGEMRRLVRDRPDIAPLQVLHCATVGGWRALGRSTESGLFSSGAPATGFVVGEAPLDVEGWSAEAVAEWALLGDSRVALCCDGVDLVSGEHAKLAGVSTFLDTVSGQG